MRIPWNPSKVITEPITQANTIAFIALGVALLAIGIVIANGVKNAH